MSKIRQDIELHYRKQKCVILGTDHPKVDRKAGRGDGVAVRHQKFSDFQPLSKDSMDAKRQHCEECRETNRRFDAKRIGFRVSQVQENGAYRGNCVGCYWYDPMEFNKRAGV